MSLISHLCQSHFFYSYFMVLCAFISSCNQLVSADVTLPLLAGDSETRINAKIKQNGATGTRTVSAVFHHRTGTYLPSFFPVKDMYSAILQAQISTGGAANCPNCTYSLLPEWRTAAALAFKASLVFWPEQVNKGVVFSSGSTTPSCHGYKL